MDKLICKFDVANGSDENKMKCVQSYQRRKRIVFEEDICWMAKISPSDQESTYELMVQDIKERYGITTLKCEADSILMELYADRKQFVLNIFDAILGEDGNPSQISVLEGDNGVKVFRRCAPGDGAEEFASLSERLRRYKIAKADCELFKVTNNGQIFGVGIVMKNNRIKVKTEVIQREA